MPLPFLWILTVIRSLLRATASSAVVPLPVGVLLSFLQTVAEYLAEPDQPFLLVGYLPSNQLLLCLTALDIDFLKLLRIFFWEGGFAVRSESGLAVRSSMVEVRGRWGFVCHKDEEIKRYTQKVQKMTDQLHNAKVFEPCALTAFDKCHKTSTLSSKSFQTSWRSVVGSSR